MVSIDTLIAIEMHFAQKLVDAEKASLFLVDHKAEELYARLFDMTIRWPQRNSIPSWNGYCWSYGRNGEVYHNYHNWPFLLLT